MLKSCLKISTGIVGFKRLGASVCRTVPLLTQSWSSIIPKKSFHKCNSLNCLKIEPRMSISFKCNVCNERSTKSFSKDAYEKGVVIISCPTCQSKHLIANNIPKFRDLGLGNIEDFMAAKGEEVKKGLQFNDDSNNHHHNQDETKEISSQDGDEKQQLL